MIYGALFGLILSTGSSPGNTDYSRRIREQLDKNTPEETSEDSGNKSDSQ